MHEWIKTFNLDSGRLLKSTPLLLPTIRTFCTRALCCKFSQKCWLLIWLFMLQNHSPEQINPSIILWRWQHCAQKSEISIYSLSWPSSQRFPNFTVGPNSSIHCFILERNLKQHGSQTLCSLTLEAQIAHCMQDPSPFKTVPRWILMMTLHVLKSQQNKNHGFFLWNFGWGDLGSLFRYSWKFTAYYLLSVNLVMVSQGYPRKLT